MRLWALLTARPRRAALWLGVLAFAGALPGLGNLAGLGHPDEQFYLSIAVDGLDHHRIAPTHDDDPVFPKPPLVFWASHLSLAVFGRNATAARLPGALAAGLTVAGGVLFTTELATAEAGVLAGALLLGCLGVVRFGRELMLDLPLTACLAFGLWAFAAASRGRRGADVWAGALWALSLGFKGPIGVAVLGLAAGFGLWREQRLAVFRQPGLWLGIALGACVSLPWYVWAAATHWPQLLQFQFQEQYLDRFETAHGQSRFNLLWGTLLYGAPLWPFALWGARQRLDAPGDGVRSAWVWGWLLSFYGLYLLPKEHGLHYPLLALVPLATLAAIARAPRGLRVAVGVVLGLAACALPAVAAFPEVPRVPLLLATALGLAAAVAMGMASRASLAASGLLLGLSVNLVIGEVAPALGRPLVSPEAQVLGQDRPLGLLWDHPGPYRLAAGWGPQATELWGDAALRQAIEAGSLVFAKDRILAHADPSATARLVPLARWRRTRPYLSVSDLLAAWRAHDLDALGEGYGLYRVSDNRPPVP